MLASYDMNTFNSPGLRDDEGEEDDGLGAINRSAFLPASPSRSHAAQGRQSKPHQPRLGMSTGKDGLARGYGGPSNVSDGMEWEPSVPSKRLRVDDENRWASTTMAAAPSPFAFTQPKQVFKRAAEAANSDGKQYAFAPWGASASTTTLEPDDDEMMGSDVEAKEALPQSRNIGGSRQNLQGSGEDAVGDVSMAVSLGGEEADEPPPHTLEQIEDVKNAAAPRDVAQSPSKGSPDDSEIPAASRPISLNGLKRVLRFRQSRTTGDGAESDRGAIVLAQPDLYEDDVAGDERNDQHLDQSPHAEGSSASHPQFNLGLGSSSFDGGLRRRVSASRFTGSGASYTFNVANYGHPVSSGHLNTWRDKQDNRDRRRASRVEHSELPYILLGYLQFVFNASVAGVCLYLILAFILTIRKDVKERMAAYTTEILQEIATCTNMYLINRCEPATRIPAMETACQDWELCMSRDPTVVGHAKVGAEMFAGVISGFVDELSWKTIFFILCTMTCLVFITNSALFSLRHKHAQAHHLASEHSARLGGGSTHAFPSFVAPVAHLQGSGDADKSQGAKASADRFLFEWPPRPT